MGDNKPGGEKKRRNLRGTDDFHSNDLSTLIFPSFPSAILFFLFASSLLVTKIVF